LFGNRKVVSAKIDNIGMGGSPEPPGD